MIGLYTTRAFMLYIYTIYYYLNLYEIGFKVNLTKREKQAKGDK